MCQKGICVTSEQREITDLDNWKTHLESKKIHWWIVKVKSKFILWREILPSDRTWVNIDGKHLKISSVPMRGKIVKERKIEEGGK